MNEAMNELRWGVVLCTRCNSIIDMVETEKPSVYYSQCRSGQCSAEPSVVSDVSYDPYSG